jgi:hypothetical protein
MGSVRRCGAGGGVWRVGWGGRRRGLSFCGGDDDGAFRGRRGCRRRGLFLLRLLLRERRIGGYSLRVVKVGGWRDQRRRMVGASAGSVCGFLRGGEKRLERGERS